MYVTVATMMSVMINKTLVTLTFDQTAGTNNRTGQNATIKRTGTAYISDIQVTAANRQNSSFSVQFQGTAGLS